jgi:hypothetical protein
MTSIAASGLLAIVLAAFGCGGPSVCRECGSTCSGDMVWPRLVVGINSTADASAIEGITLESLNAKGEVRKGDTPGAGGVAFNYCGCLGHIKGLVCTKAYIATPDEREIIVRVLRNGNEIGRCTVNLAEHNYCGVDMTSLQVATDGADQFECGTPTRLNVCN